MDNSDDEQIKISGRKKRLRRLKVLDADDDDDNDDNNIIFNNDEGEENAQEVLQNTKDSKNGGSSDKILNMTGNGNGTVSVTGTNPAVADKEKDKEKPGNEIERRANNDAGVNNKSCEDGDEKDESSEDFEGVDFHDADYEPDQKAVDRVKTNPSTNIKKEKEKKKKKVTNNQDQATLEEKRDSASALDSRGTSLDASTDNIPLSGQPLVRNNFSLAEAAAFLRQKKATTGPSALGSGLKLGDPSDPDSKMDTGTDMATPSAALRKRPRSLAQPESHTKSKTEMALNSLLESRRVLFRGNSGKVVPSSSAAPIKPDNSGPSNTAEQPSKDDPSMILSPTSKDPDPPASSQSLGSVPYSAHSAVPAFAAPSTVDGFLNEHDNPLAIPGPKKRKKPGASARKLIHVDIPEKAKEGTDNPRTPHLAQTQTPFSYTPSALNTLGKSFENPPKDEPSEVQGNIKHLASEKYASEFLVDDSTVFISRFNTGLGIQAFEMALERFGDIHGIRFLPNGFSALVSFSSQIAALDCVELKAGGFAKVVRLASAQDDHRAQEQSQQETADAPYSLLTTRGATPNIPKTSSYNPFERFSSLSKNETSIKNQTVSYQPISPAHSSSPDPYRPVSPGNSASPTPPHSPAPLSPSDPKIDQPTKPISPENGTYNPASPTLSTEKKTNDDIPKTPNMFTDDSIPNTPRIDSENESESKPVGAMVQQPNAPQKLGLLEEETKLGDREKMQSNKTVQNTRAETDQVAKSVERDRLLKNGWPKSPQQIDKVKTPVNTPWITESLRKSVQKLDVPFARTNSMEIKKQDEQKNFSTINTPKMWEFSEQKINNTTSATANLTERAKQVYVSPTPPRMSLKSDQKIDDILSLLPATASGRTHSDLLMAQGNQETKDESGEHKAEIENTNDSFKDIHEKKNTTAEVNAPKEKPQGGGTSRSRSRSRMRTEGSDSEEGDILRREQNRIRKQRKAREEKRRGELLEAKEKEQRHRDELEKLRAQEELVAAQKELEERRIKEEKEMEKRRIKEMENMAGAFEAGRAFLGSLGRSIEEGSERVEFLEPIHSTFERKVSRPRNAFDSLLNEDHSLGRVENAVSRAPHFDVKENRGYDNGTAGTFASASASASIGPSFGLAFPSKNPTALTPLDHSKTRDTTFGYDGGRNSAHSSSAMLPLSNTPGPYVHSILITTMGDKQESETLPNYKMDSRAPAVVNNRGKRESGKPPTSKKGSGVLKKDNNKSRVFDLINNDNDGGSSEDNDDDINDNQNENQNQNFKLKEHVTNMNDERRVCPDLYENERANRGLKSENVYRPYGMIPTSSTDMPLVNDSLDVRDAYMVNSAYRHHSDVPSGYEGTVMTSTGSFNPVPRLALLFDPTTTGNRGDVGDGGMRPGSLEPLSSKYAKEYGSDPMRPKSEKNSITMPPKYEEFGSNLISSKYEREYRSKPLTSKFEHKYSSDVYDRIGSGIRVGLDGGGSSFIPGVSGISSGGKMNFDTHMKGESVGPGMEREEFLLHPSRINHGSLMNSFTNPYAPYSEKNNRGNNTKFLRPPAPSHLHPQQPPPISHQQGNSRVMLEPLKGLDTNDSMRTINGMTINHEALRVEGMMRTSKFEIKPLRLEDHDEEKPGERYIERYSDDV